MQKDIGSIMALYPTPVTVVGTMLDNGKANFLTIAHVGVVEHGHLLISIDQSHELSDAAIQKNGVVSVSLINQALLRAADYCGITKGAEKSKSNAFVWHPDDLEKAPVLDDAPVSMSCRITDMITVGSFHNYILEPVHTYVQEQYLNEKGKINYEDICPILFEFQNGKYLSTGKVIADCWSYGKDYQPGEHEKYGIECTLLDGNKLELLCYMNTSKRWSGHDYAKVFRMDKANTALLLSCLGEPMPETGEAMKDIIDKYFGHYWYSKKFETYCEDNEIHYEWATHVEYPCEYYDAGQK